jgi:hypothetical protein
VGGILLLTRAVAADDDDVAFEDGGEYSDAGSGDGGSEVGSVRRVELE